MGIKKFPEIFENKDFSYIEHEKTLAHADGLLGWALCMSGNKPPEMFGMGMLKIGKILGINPTHEALMELKAQE